MSRILTIFLPMLAYALSGAAEINLHADVDSLPKIFGSASVVLAGEMTSVEQTEEANRVWYGNGFSLRNL